MQINSAHLASIYPPKLLELQDNTRKPVTIDVKASVEFDADLNSPSSTKIVPPNQAAIRVNDQQQAQLVRFFSVNDLSSPMTSIDTPSQASYAKLPNGVQQYLQVAATSLEFQQSLLDETV